jgi:tetratricopeptide (TPR) repeat protein
MTRLLFIALFATAAIAPLSAAPSEPAMPAEPREPREVRPDIEAYNAGCALLKKKKWKDAQHQFEAALKAREAFAEAHNNLAFVLRAQGEHNFPESLTHYKRAIELNPKLPEAYQYRGALYVFMGRLDLAEADYTTLQKLKPSLAKRLRSVIDNGKEEAGDYSGVAKTK